MYDIVALVPMKNTSRRVPGKNYREFGDKNMVLFEYIISTLLCCKVIDKVVIDTDSDIIKDICQKKYKDIIIINRPAHLADDCIPMNDVIKYDISQVNSRFYLQTHSTNPLLSSKSIENAIATFKKNYPVYSSLFSVTQIQTRLWDQLTRSINHNPNILLRTQDLPPVYEENSCIYIFEKERFLKTENRISKQPYMFEVNKTEAIDIDTEFDFKIAESIWRTIKLGENQKNK